MKLKEKKALLDYLLPFVTENKRDKMLAVIKDRTQHITVVLEDILQPHNASAVIRSCEIFGLQDLHVVQEKNKFLVTNGIAMGASKWIDMQQYNEIDACIQTLKDDGYRIVATTPHTDACLLPDLPVDKKLALVFGTEGSGISSRVMEQADEFVKIPMFGFTQSFNVSVSVALCLYDTVMRLHNSSINWQLNETQKIDTLLLWARKVLRNADALEKTFFDQQSSK